MDGSMMQVYHNFVTQIGLGKRIKIIFVTTTNILKLDRLNNWNSFVSVPFVCWQRTNICMSDAE